MDGGFDFNFLFASEGNASQGDAQGNSNDAANVMTANTLTGAQDTDGAATTNTTTDALTDVEQGFDFFLDAFAQSTDTVAAPVVAQEAMTHVPAEHNAVSVRVEDKPKDVSTAPMHETSVCEITAADVTSVQLESKTTVPQTEAITETNVTAPEISTSVRVEQPPPPTEAKPPTVPRSTQAETCSSKQEQQLPAAIVKSPQQAVVLPSLPIASSTTVITKTNPSTSNAAVSVDELTAQVKQLMQSVAPLVQDDTSAATMVNNNEENESAADGAATSDAEFAQMAGQLLRHAGQSRTEAARIAAQLQMKAVALMEMLGPHAGLASILGKEYASTPVTNLIPLLIPLLQELLRE